MLKYGFDFAQPISVQIDPSEGALIQSTTGATLTTASAVLSYDIKSSLPVLQSFDRLDALGNYVDSDDRIGYYETFSFDSGSGKSGTFYGLQLRYQFNEEVSVVGEESSDLEAYTFPTNAYYVNGSNGGDADFLLYTEYAYTGSQLPDSNSDNANNNGYGSLVSGGSLLQSFSSGSDPISSSWYHLAYLSLDETFFTNEISDHNYSVRYDDAYVSTNSNQLPAIFGDVKQINNTTFTATHFADEDGNPARVSPDWFATNDSPGSQQLVFDTKAPELISATALNVNDSNNDTRIDNYAGTFGLQGDTATFSFELVFSEQLGSVDQLKDALIWNISATHNTTGAAVDPIDLSAVSDVSDPVITNDPTTGDPIFTYTVTNAVSGLFDTTGTYDIKLDDSKDLTDPSGTPIDFDAANSVLGDPALCFFGVCSYSQTPVTLTSASISPSLVTVVGKDSSAFSEFNLTLSFSAPVYFVPDPGLNDVEATRDAFTMDYVNLATESSITSLQSGASISTEDYTQTIASALQPVGDATVDSGISYYSQYVVQFDDNIGLWARDNYGDAITDSSGVSIYFNFDDITAAARATDSSGSVLNINYLEKFATVDGAQPTILSTSAVTEGNTEIFMVDPANEQNVFTKLKYNLITNTPSLHAATPVAASSANSQNQNPDTPVARHVKFDFDDTLLQSYGASIGMLMLYRTEDNAFTNDDSATAPYYGADGGVFISGSDLDVNNIGYHICPPFSDHIHGHQAGSPSVNAPLSYNSNRLKIHYIAIPYVNGSAQLDDTEISNLNPFTVDFSANPALLSDTEPCVRSTFYNEGVGQYGYIVDTDRDEEMMLIANAVLQNADGYNLDDARLPIDQHNNVYFDLYTRDYFNDSWQKDLTITLAQVLADLDSNIGAAQRHDIADGVTIDFDATDADATIFASRFINTINARFLNNVFLDGLTAGDLKGYDLTINDYVDSEITPIYEAHDALGIAYSVKIVSTSSTDSGQHLFQPPAYIRAADHSAATLAPTNQNRLVLSVGVHPAAITVNTGSSNFTPFATDPAQLLEMDAAFYDLHYGGNSTSATRPAFDYTSRHLAYVNFDLVYQLTRDATTGAITSYELKEIVSPFSLLQAELFSSSTLSRMQANGEVYSGVAASIADNIVRHNFLARSSNSQVGHYLPTGAYCRLGSVAASATACANSFAQMLLPDPSDGTTHQRNQISDHYLHRHLLRLDPADYSPIETTENANYQLLENLIQLYNSYDDGDDRENVSGINKVIDERSYSSIIYNSFDRSYGLNYSNVNLTFGVKNSLDGAYISDSGGASDPAYNFEQSFFGLAPFAESPNARADQIFPNAFLLGNQANKLEQYFHFIVKPYQHTGYTSDIKPNLSAADDLNLISSHIYSPHGLSGTSQTFYVSGYYPETSDYFMPAIRGYGIPYYSGSTIAFSPAAGPRVDLNKFGYDKQYSKGYPLNVPFAHIIATAPEHSHEVERHTNIGRTDTTQGSEYHYYYPSLFSGRLPGMSTDTAGSSAINDFAAHKEYQHDFADNLRPAVYGSGGASALWANSDTRGGDIPLSQRYSAPSGSFYEHATISNNYYGETVAAVDSFDQRIYTDGRVLTPADDYDFDRGQTLARQLGFFLNEGIVLQPANSDLSQGQWHGSFSNIFLPTSPDTDVGPVNPIVADYNSPTVANYYPLVKASETLYTSSTSLPTIAVAYAGGLGTNQSTSYVGSYMQYSSVEYSSGYRYGNSGDYAGMRFGAYDDSTGTVSTSQDDTSNSGAIYHHIPLDKIFPAGYSYQLGFINREELFMYDPASGNGDNDSIPQINRFSEAGVGSFGYATQYNRLNRRSMIEIHQSTASHFLGDHLARFQGTPSAGVHISNDIDNPYAHTPVNQGATGTNYGSYGEGHYDITTGDSSATGGTWQHRTYSGTLRGYVVEMRMNPIYTTPVYEFTNIHKTEGDPTLGPLYNAGSDFTDNTSDR